MTLDELAALEQRIRKANASVKFGHPKYTATVDSQSLLRLLDGIKAMLPVAGAAEHLCGPGGIDNPPAVLELAVATMHSMLGGIK